MRRWAAMTLGQLGAAAKGAAPALVRRLTDENARVRAATVTALERLGPVAAAGLREGLSNADPRRDADVRGEAVAALKMMDPETVRKAEWR